MQTIIHTIKLSLYGLLISFCSFVSADPQAPFTIKQNLFDSTQPITLGLTKPTDINHIQVFKAISKKAQYNHGAVLFPFKGKLYIQWQSSKQDEDAAETKILFSVSKTGTQWRKAKTLVAARKNAIITNGGWWSDGKTLIAYINVWPTNMEPKGGYVEYISSKDGEHWSKPKRLLSAAGNFVEGVIEQDLKPLASGRILTTVHIQPGLIAKPYYTDDALGISGWTQGEMQNLEHQPGISRELEPSWFLNRQGKITMVFRDQESSFKVLAAESDDNGKTWTKPVITNMPDARAKQSAGNFPDGRAFLVNNPSGSKQRTPLVLTLSQDGYLFDKAYLLKAENELPPMKYEGKYKRIGFSYPKSIIWQNRLWVSYAVNKEDIEVTSVALEGL
jgi:hypothetical protein